MDGLTACAGYWGSENNCYTMKDGQWYESHQLSSGRFFHTSWLVGDELILMGGHYASNPNTRVDTTEVLALNSASTTEGFKLKIAVR